MNEIKSTLAAARALIADPEHWTQGAYAIENTGNEVYPDESNAYAFCSIGAVAKVAGVHFADDGMMVTTLLFEVCQADLSRAACALFNNGHVSSINDGELHDDPADAHKDALAIFDKAIANAA